jgi:hypothetical protein
LIVEALSFKLALDFFKYLKKYRINATDIKIDFFDRVKHEYVDFANLDEMQLYYDEYYVPINNCFLGDLGGIQLFRATSDTYNFPTSYKAIDVIGNYKLEPGSGFDIQRNQQRQVLKDRQRDVINNAVSEYRRFYNELRNIYITGIYSPCYAEPGWSENTWYLKSLREALTNSTNTSQFPYKNTNIQKKPPRGIGGKSVTINT